MIIISNREGDKNHLSIAAWYKAAKGNCWEMCIGWFIQHMLVKSIRSVVNEY